MSTSGSAQRAGAEVRLVNLSRNFGGVAAVRTVTATVAPGEFLTLLGASGSGKTTTLMMIAGFVSPSSGDVLIGGRSVVRMPPDKRNLGVVFQSYALFPHMSVAENVGFPLRMRGIDKSAIRQRVGEALEMVHMGALGERRITEISGGQQQRVALARALVFRPPVLLMDEPLGALDRKLREHMQAEIKHIQRSLGLTVIYVTHDQEEALVMSDRIAIMHDGLIQQIDGPAAVYERPANAYVADFLGESNFLDGTVERSGGDETVIRLAGGAMIRAQASGFDRGAAVRAMVRPEVVRIAPADDPAGGTDANRIPGLIEEGEYLGQSLRYRVAAGGTGLTVREPRRPATELIARGLPVTIAFEPAHTLVFPA